MLTDNYICCLLDRNTDVVFFFCLWSQVAYSYTYELRPYLDLLLQILLIEDSWQTHR